MTSGSSRVWSNMKSEADKMRRKARRGHLDQMFLEQNGLCYFCKSACALIKYIKKEDIVALSCTVVWKVGDEMIHAKVATTDHLVPLREGGRNDEGNLVMACMDCNKDRTSQRRMPHNRMCRKCGDPLRGTRRRYCTPCFVDLARDWLFRHGWAETPSETDERHTRFIDPETKTVHILSMACDITRKRLNLRGRGWEGVVEDHRKQELGD